jgi:uncharacterized protein YggE
MSEEDEETGRDDPTPLPRRSFRISLFSVLVAAVVVAVVLGGVALSVAAGTSGATATHPPASCGPTTPKLTVHGTGQATATPDLLTVVVQVVVTEPTAATALATDNTKAAAVVAAFEGGGAQAKDIQTSGLSLQPQYSYPKGVPTVTGYQVINAVTAALHDIAQSGAVIDAVVGVGGNAVQIESLAFSTRDPSAVEAQARARATTQAVTYARALARAAGRSLGPVCSLNDQSQVPASGNALEGAPFASAVAAPNVPIESGSQTQTAQVALVFALVQARGHQAKP